MNNKTYKKLNYLFIFLVGLFVPFFANAKTDLDSLWADRYSANISPNVVFDTGSISEYAIFLIYLFIAIAASVAFLTIFVGAIKLYTADNHEDNYYAAKYTFVTGILSLIVAISLFFSLDYIFNYVGELTHKIT